ncbi:MAG: type II secretion system protein [Patescibacteria group bacterium]
MKKRSGFTLIELLIVIGLIAILAGVVFVALDPFTRFRDARNARRNADVASIASAVRVNQVDIGGRYMYGLRTANSPTTFTGPANAWGGTFQNNNIVLGETYMIAVATGTTDGSPLCNTGCAGVAGVTSISHCVNIAPLVTGGYLGSLPRSPAGAQGWGGSYSGYYLRVNGNSSLTVGACDVEGGAAIQVTR